MKQAITTISSGRNHYTYYRAKRELTLSHPLMAHMVELHDNGIDLEKWRDSQKGRSVNIPGLGRFKKREIDHYYKKFLLLQANGYFPPEKPKNDVRGFFHPEAVKNSLANIKQVTFEVTERCQLSCKYCGYGDFYNDYDQRENKNLSTNTARRLLDYLGEYWNSPQNLSHDRNIYIGFYGGEPLLNMDFIRDITAHVKSMPMEHNHFTFAMTTNGLLVEKYMDFLVENRFNLLISLDGDRKGNGYRVLQNGRPAFDDIIKNIEALEKRHPEYFRRRVNFHAVHHKLNTVEGIFHYIKDHYGKLPLVNEISATGINPEKRDQFMEAYADISGSLSQASDYQTVESELFINLPNIKEMSIFLHHYGGCTYRDYPSLAFPHKKSARIPSGTCFPFSRKMYVTVNGKILPCETVGHRFALGTVSDSAVELDFQQIADFYNSRFDALRSLCRRCYNLDTCQACLFNMEFKDGRPNCKRFCSYDDFSRYVSEHMTGLEETPGLSRRILQEVVSE